MYCNLVRRLVLCVVWVFGYLDRVYGTFKTPHELGYLYHEFSFVEVRTYTQYKFINKTIYVCTFSSLHLFCFYIV